MSHPKPTNGVNSDYPARLGNAIDALDRRLKGNLLDNGAFQIWQRGTSFASGASAVYTADRWQFIFGGAAGATASQQAGVTAQFAMRLQRNNGNAGTSAVLIAQSMETINSIPLANRTVTLKCLARCGANFSAASSQFTIRVATGTGTDQNIVTGGFTGIAFTDSVQTVSTSQAVREATFTIPAGITQCGVEIFWTPTGTAGANDWLDLEEVQLVVGDFAGNFPYRSIAEETVACKRHCRVEAFRVPATTAVSERINMRATPTITGGGAGYTSTGTTADAIVHFQTTGAVQTLTLSADI